MDELNPYASPTPVDDRAFHPQGDLYRDGNLLVVRHNAKMPRRCVFCNAPSQTTFGYDAAPSFALGRLMLRLRICPEHHRRKRRNYFIRLAVGLLLLATVVFIARDKPVPAVVLLTLPVTLFNMMIEATIFPKSAIRRMKTDKQYVWLRGISPEFLDELPVWNN